jgi:hypothetical protein
VDGPVQDSAAEAKAWVEKNTILVDARSVRKRDHPFDQGLHRASIVSTTVGQVRGCRARGQLWAFIYLAIWRLFELVVLSSRAEGSLALR